MILLAAGGVPDWDQRAEQLFELTTPVVQLWEGVVAVALIGTLDSARLGAAGRLRARERSEALARGAG